MKAQKGKLNPKTDAGKTGAISLAGRRIILAGIALLVAGFILLTKTDPAGQNWASNLSPFMILGGYLIIGIGIVFPESASGKKIAG